MEFFIRTGKIGFWWLLPIVLISNTGTSDNRLLAETFVEDGPILHNGRGNIRGKNFGVCRF